MDNKSKFGWALTVGSFTGSAALGVSAPSKGAADGRVLVIKLQEITAGVHLETELNSEKFSGLNAFMRLGWNIQFLKERGSKNTTSYMAIAAPFESHERGSVFLYSKAGPLSPPSQQEFPGAANNNRFGLAMTVLETGTSTYNGPVLVVGAPRASLSAETLWAGAVSFVKLSV